MSSLFDSPRICIERAREHINTLDVTTDKLFENAELYFDIQEADESGRHLVLCKCRVEIPSSLPAIASDAVANIRQSLDQALSASYESLTGSETRKISFPFAKKKDDLEGEIKRKCNGLEPEIKDIVRNLEPHSEGNHALWALHDLCIENKHRRLGVIGHAVNDADGKFRVFLEAGDQVYDPRHWLDLQTGMKIGLLTNPDTIEGYLKVRTALAFVKSPVANRQSATTFLNEVAAMVESIIMTVEAETARILASRL